MAKEPVKVKVCGLTRLEDAQCAVDLGAWALGFIFYPKSKRLVSAEKVAQIIGRLKKSKAKTVGVFVNPTLDEIGDVLAEVDLTTLQLHGNETAEFVKTVKMMFPGIEIIKATRLGEPLPQVNANFTLLDHADSKDWGGTGQKVDWAAAAKLNIKNLILAGGLDSRNIKEALEKVKPYAVDLSSGLESAPGIKNEMKMIEFFDVIDDEENL